MCCTSVVSVEKQILYDQHKNERPSLLCSFLNLFCLLTWCTSLQSDSLGGFCPAWCALTACWENPLCPHVGSSILSDQLINFKLCLFHSVKKKKQTHSTAWIFHAFSHIELSLGSRCRCSYRSSIHSTASSLPVLEYSYLFCEFEGSGLVFNLVWVLLDYFLSWIETNPREFGYII